MIPVPSIKLIKREGVTSFRAALPFMTAFVIALGAFTYNNTVMRSIAFAFLLHTFSVDSARKVLRFRQLWIMSFMFTVSILQSMDLLYAHNPPFPRSSLWVSLPS